MSKRLFALAAALLITSVTPILAESLTGTVTEWDPTDRTITLDDMSKFASIPETVTVPANLKAGDRVIIDYEGGENGYEIINSITIIKNNAK
jgi:hypothetical protein